MKSSVILLFALAFALLFTFSASKDVKVSSKTNCERVDGAECSDRVKEKGPLVTGNRTGSGGHLAPDGANPQDVGAQKNGCYYSSWYYRYVPSGYYTCGSKHFQTYSSKQTAIISSQYCYAGYVYGTVSSYVYTSGSCYISYAYYQVFSNAVAIRAYYCCY